MFRRLAAFLIIGFLGLFSVPGLANDKEIRLVFPEAGYPPYLLAQPKGSSGILVDVLATALKSEGYSLSVSHAPELRGHLMLEQGKADLFPHAKGWSQRPHKYDWTDPVLEVADHVIVLRNSNLQVNSVNDLKGLSVGTLYQFTYPSFEAHFKSGEIKRLDGRTVPILLKMLERKRIDALILDRRILAWEVRNNSQFEASAFRVSNKSFDSVGYGFKVAKGERMRPVLEALNRVLAKMRETGAIGQIVSKYQ